MKKLFTIVTLFFILFEGYAISKNSNPVTNPKEPIKTPMRVYKHEILKISIPDKIFIQSSIDKPEIEMKGWSKNMPWIGAILIGFLTVGGNIIISRYSRKSNATVALQQIENAKEIASKQMEQLRINSERDFNKTVLSGTRQLWINDFRTVISELLSLVAVFSQKQTMELESNYQLHLLVTKAEFMLSDEPSQIQLRNKLGNLKECCTHVMADNKSFDDLETIVSSIKINTLIVLKEEFEKAKKGE